MNGRVYDPGIGRFLSADPIIQAPYNSQSYNRYSYVWNNPLSNTDPSGFLKQRDKDCGPDKNCDGHLDDHEREWAKDRCERMTPGHPNCRTVSNGDGTFSTMPSEVADAFEALRDMRFDTGGNEPDDIRNEAEDTGLGLTIEDDKLSGEIVFGCDGREMENCRTVVTLFDKFVADNKDFLAITNTLVVDTAAYEIHLNFPTSSGNKGGEYRSKQKVLELYTKYGLTERIVLHEYGHVLGLFHQWNDSKNFMSYYDTHNIHGNTRYLEGYQRKWLIQAYTPWYGGILEWFD